MESLQQLQPISAGDNPAEAWTKWRTRFEVYLTATGMDTKAAKRQKALLLHWEKKAWTCTIC